MFEHCSLCFRVRMTAALKRLHLQETVILDDDSDTMIGLVGRRVISILVKDSGQPMLESMDMVSYVDSIGQPVLIGQNELQQVYARLRKAGGTVIEQGATSCCYAKSEKSWIDDPAGISWETFHTTGESINYGDSTGERVARVAHTKACCAPPVVPEAVAPATERGAN